MRQVAFLRRRVQNGVLKAVPLLLLAALFPSLSYIDHWGEFSGESEPPIESEHARHESHCHFGPSTCVEQPGTAGIPGLSGAFELPEPKLTTIAVEEATEPFDEVSVAPPTEPPRV